MRIVLMLSLAVLGWLFAGTTMAAPDIPWRLVDTRTHDRNAFTQGLVVDSERLIEGVGLYGRSGLVIRDLVSDRVLAAVRLPANHFGEGVAVVGSRIIQLTWQNGIAHVFNERLQPLTTFRYDGEGWGLTHDGRQLIRSDGTARLRFHDSDNFRETSAVVVMDGSSPVSQLNELEYADGLLYANVWQSDRIAIIDSATGTVRGWLDLAALSKRVGLVAGKDTEDAVLNGIASVGTGRLLVTGKLWPLMFVIEIDLKALGAR